MNATATVTITVTVAPMSWVRTVYGWAQVNRAVDGDTLSVTYDRHTATMAWTRTIPTSWVLEVAARDESMTVRQQAQALAAR